MATTNPFGELLVRLRKQAGMSRSQLSEASELSYPYISQLETGQRSPSRKSVWTIARALSVDPSVLEGSVPADDSDPEALERLGVGVIGRYGAFQHRRIHAQRPRDRPHRFARRAALSGLELRDVGVGQLRSLGQLRTRHTGLFAQPDEEFAERICRSHRLCSLHSVSYTH